MPSLRHGYIEEAVTKMLSVGKNVHGFTDFGWDVWLQAKDPFQV
jgi:hypothetical protein